MIAPQWPHMRRSMATVLAELDYRESAWAEHEAIAAQIFAGNAKAAEAAALAHAQTAGTNDRGETEGDRQGGVTGNALILRSRGAASRRMGQGEDCDSWFETRAARSAP